MISTLMPGIWSFESLDMGIVAKEGDGQWCEGFD